MTGGWSISFINTNITCLNLPCEGTPPIIQNTATVLTGETLTIDCTLQHITTGTGNLVEVTDPGAATNGTNFFYRVRLMLP